MEYMNYIFIALIFFFIIQRLLPIKGVKNISTADLKQELKDNNKQYVDVRTPREFSGNYIKGFKNIPVHQISKNVDKNLSKEKEVIVICQSGMRSRRACKMLKRMGFTKVTNVKGGMNAWFK